jgi:hypothetical protein
LERIAPSRFSIHGPERATQLLSASLRARARPFRVLLR